MNFLIIFAAAFGMALATPAGFLQNTPSVQQATLNFIREYNRLAKLAAEAPDIHIYTSESRLRPIEAAPTVRQQRVKPRRHAIQDIYSFSANLGTNQQFQPHQLKTFHQPQANVVSQKQKRQPAIQQPSIIRHPIIPQAQVAPVVVQKWNGPLADTVPAGVHGIPTPVTETPAVAAARNLHFKVLLDAYQRAALQQQLEQQHRNKA